MAKQIDLKGRIALDRYEDTKVIFRSRFRDSVTSRLVTFMTCDLSRRPQHGEGAAPPQHLNAEAALA